MASKDIAEESARLQHLFKAKILSIESEIAELKEIADKQNQINRLLYLNSKEIEYNDPAAQIKSYNERCAELIYAELQEEKCILLYDVLKLCALPENDKATAKRIIKIVADNHPEQCRVLSENSDGVHLIYRSKKD